MLGKAYFTAVADESYERLRFELREEITMLDIFVRINLQSFTEQSPHAGGLISRPSTVNLKASFLLYESVTAALLGSNTNLE